MFSVTRTAKEVLYAIDPFHQHNNTKHDSQTTPAKSTTQGLVSQQAILCQVQFVHLKILSQERQGLRWEMDDGFEIFKGGKEIS